MVCAVACSYGLPAFKSHPSQGFEGKFCEDSCALSRFMSQDLRYHLALPIINKSTFIKKKKRKNYVSGIFNLFQWLIWLYIKIAPDGTPLPKSASSALGQSILIWAENVEYQYPSQ